MAKQVSVEIEVNSSQVDQTVQKLGQLKDLGRGLKIQYDIDGKPIDIAIDKSLNLQKQVKILTAELRRTKEGTAEFQMLSSRLGQAQDELAKTTAKSKDLFSSLSMIPGPVGQFFSQLQGGIELLKTFSSFTFKDLQFQFKETADDIADIGKNLGGIDSNAIDDVKDSASELGDTLQNTAAQAGGTSAALSNVAKSSATVVDASGQVTTAASNAAAAATKQGQSIAGMTAAQAANVNVTRQATVATNQLAASEATATVATNTLAAAIKGALIGTGIGIAIVLIGELIAMLYRFVSSTEDAEIATRSLTGALEEQQRVLENDLTALDMANKASITRAKIAGQTEEQITKLTLKGGEDRLNALRDYDNQLYKLQDDLKNNTKISGEERLKLTKDINDKILKNGQDITKQILTNEQIRLDDQLRIANKNREGSKKIQEKKVDDTKLANEMLLELNKENALAAISDERTRQYRELELQAATEVDKVNALKVSEEKKGELRNQIFLKYAKKQIDLKKKFDDEDIKKIQEQGQKVADFAGKLEDMRIAAIEDATKKEVEQRKNKFSDEVKDLDKALKDKIITQEQYNAAI